MCEGQRAKVTYWGDNLNQCRPLDDPGVVESRQEFLTFF